MLKIGVCTEVEPLKGQIDCQPAEKSKIIGLHFVSTTGSRIRVGFTRIWIRPRHSQLWIIVILHEALAFCAENF